MRLPVWVLEEIEALPARFTGHVQLNCFEGGVANINIVQSMKADGRPKDRDPRRDEAPTGDRGRWS